MTNALTTKSNNAIAADQVHGADWTLDDGVNRGASDQVGYEIWQVPFDKLILREELRIETPQYLDQIRELADAIKKNGFQQDRPVDGMIEQRSDKWVALVLDGALRIKSALLAASEGADIKTIPVRVRVQGVNAIEEGATLNQLAIPAQA